MKKLAFILAGLFITAQANSRQIMRDADLYYGQHMLLASAGPRPTGDQFRDFNCDGFDCNNAAASGTEPARTPEPQRNRTAPRQNEITRTHITNPFFQPGEGQITSLTDLGYMGERIKMNINITNPPGTTRGGNTGDWRFSNDLFAITQNLAYGITDDISIIGNVRYLLSEASVSGIEGHGTDSRIDTFGLGLRWMFVDNIDWVGYLQGSYQSVRDIANLFSARVQVGYKNDDTVIYVFGQAQYYNWDVRDIGFGVINQKDQMLYFETQGNLSGSVYFEIGAGAFMAFNNDWALDANVVIADRDWHRQIYGMVRLNYQAWDNAAVSFYGRLALWDNMDNQDDLNVWYRDSVFGHDYIGSASIIGSNSFAVGTQLTLLF
jgi:hypothetical protein